MSKFNKGDRVNIVKHYDNGYPIDTKYNDGVIEDVSRDIVGLRMSDGCYFAARHSQITKEECHEFQVGDEVEVTKYSSGFPVGTHGVITATKEWNHQEYRYRVDTDNDFFWQSEDELSIQKYLVVNATSGKSVGFMTKEQGINYAAHNSAMKVQLYSLAYNVVPKTVEYEAVAPC